MTVAILNLKKWGNSLGLRLPVAISSAAHLIPDQQVRIEVNDGNVVITPILQMTLLQRLELYNPTRHGGEVMVTKADIGAEQW